MIYDDVENGDDGGNSSLEYGWSSSEFESYEEQSDSECKNGIPSSFLRGNHKRHVCILQCCSVIEVILISNTCLSHLYFPSPQSSFKCQQHRFKGDVNQCGSDSPQQM